jgi:hypothetical protein
MREERPDGLTREEHAAYASLRERVDPPPGLEDRVVRALAGEGLVRRTPGLLERLTGGRIPPLVPRLALVAAVAAAFVVGVEVGKRADEPSVPEAVLEPESESGREPPALEEVDGDGIMVASGHGSLPETSWVQVTALDKPGLEETGAGDYRPYPLDGELRPYSVSR